MKKNNVSVFGIYSSQSFAENAVDALKHASFTSSDVSVLLPEASTTRDFAHEKHTKAPEGTVTGAGTGALLGGTMGWLVGMGTLAIPGIGPFVAAGPILAALAGVGVGGAVGGLAGALIGMGIPEYEAKRYEGIVKNGGILLSVHTDQPELVKQARSLLESTGARDISSSREAESEDDNRPDLRARPRPENPTSLRLHS